MRQVKPCQFHKFNIAIIWTPMFEWYVIRCGAKNEHQNTMYFKDIGLDAQNMLTLGSIHNKIRGDLYG